MQPFPKADTISYLNNAIVRVAVLEARKLIAQGSSADEAVDLACPGPWSQLRLLLRARARLE
jgi:hypothetical protein